MTKPWILKKDNIKKLWILLYVLLVFLILIQFIFPIYGHFAIEGWVAFAAWFGFLSCVVMVVVAKILGFLVKREDSYYEKNSKK